MTYEEMKEAIKDLHLETTIPSFHGFREGVGPRRFEMADGPNFGIYCFSDTLYTGAGSAIWKIYSGGWLSKNRQLVFTGTEEEGIFGRYYILIRAMGIQVQQSRKA